jgi:class 3 adenylate cyclase
MLDRLAQGLYRRLRRRYRWVFGAAELSASLLVASLAVVLILSYYRHTVGQFAVIYAVVCGATLLGVGLALRRGLIHLAPLDAWLAQPPGTSTTPETVAAWDAAANYPMRSFRANSLGVAVVALVPTVSVVTAELHLAWSAVPVLLLAGSIPLAYGTAVNYALAELLIRPVVAAIASQLPEDFPFSANGLLLRKRLKLLLPIFTSFSGFVVAALVASGGGTSKLLLSAVAALGVGFVFSFEMTVLLSRSVTGPVAQLRHAVRGIRTADYGARVPVMTSDELGELSHDFNLMASAVAERARVRQALSTYIDPEIVPLILSGAVPPEGVEVNVSIMFVDARGFTAFAESATPQQVVRALNRLFEQIVPIIRRHGGHIDKFLGDGLLAVFGAPEDYGDHADRAVAAAIDIVVAINRGRGLHVGVGVNTGPIVAGSIGGGGRLDFSVVGDAVNVAARVQAATRETGDDILITRLTRDALARPVAFATRGGVELKGKREPIEVFAVAVPDGTGVAEPPPEAPDAATETRQASIG